MPLILWRCTNDHEFERLEQKAPDDSETRTCLACGEVAKQIIGRPAPPRFAGKPWNS